MAALATSGLTLPKHLASGIWSKAQTGSTIAALIGSEPQQFGVTQYMTFTTKPRAEVVAEGANKADVPVAFSTKDVLPRKVHTTMRFNEEVVWADEDYQLGVLTELSNAGAEALARAIDLIIYHGINPLTGAALSGSPAKVLDTTNVVEILDGTSGNAALGAELEMQAAVGLVLADGFTPNAVALDNSYAFTLATDRFTDGRKRFPDLGYGTNISNFEGLRASVSDTVSGGAEGITASTGVYSSTNPNVKAIVGDFSQIRWGVQRTVPVELIRFGDPDGLGDLKRKNQVALRLEMQFGFVIMDLNAFAQVKNATNES